MSVGAGQLRQLHVLQIIQDIAPRILTSALNGTLKHKCQHRDGDMRVDTVRCPVEHRPHLQTTLHRPPSLFHPLLLFVAQRHVFSRERVIVAIHHELAVKALQVGHRLAVNRRTLFRFLQPAPPVAGAAAKGADPSGRTSKTVKRLTSRCPTLIRRVTKKVYVIFGKGGFLSFTSLLPIITDSIKPHFEWKNHGTQVTLALVLYCADEKLNIEKLTAKTYQLKPVANMGKKT